MVHQHIVRSYDEDLNQLQTKIAEMGGLVELQLAKAMQALIKGDVKLAEQVIEKDNVVDECENEIDTFSLRMLALRQPMAEDLRMIVAGHKVAANLERIGDYAKNIAKRTTALTQTSYHIDALKTLERMGELAQTMIKNVLDAYINADVEMARDVIARDEEVDKLNTILFKELLATMMEDPDRATTCTHLLFVAKNIERVGDHATTIADRIYFIVLGESTDDERQKEDLSSLTVVTNPEDEDENE